MFILDHEIILEMDLNDINQQQQFNNFYQFTLSTIYDVPAVHGVRMFSYDGRTVLASDDFESLISFIEPDIDDEVLH